MDDKGLIIICIVLGCFFLARILSSDIRSERKRQLQLDLPEIDWKKEGDNSAGAKVLRYAVGGLFCLMAFGALGASAGNEFTQFVFGILMVFIGFAAFKSADEYDEKRAREFAARAQAQTHQVAMHNERVLAPSRTKESWLKQQLSNLDLQESIRSRPEEHRRAQELKAAQHATQREAEYNKQTALRVATGYGLDLATFNNLVSSIANMVMSIVGKQVDTQLDINKAIQLKQAENQQYAEKLSIAQDNITRVQLQDYEIRDKKMARYSEVSDEYWALRELPKTPANQDKLAQVSAEREMLLDELYGDKPIQTASRQNRGRDLQSSNSGASDWSETDEDEE